MEKLSKKELQQLKELEEYEKELAEDQREDQLDEQNISSIEFQEGYGPPDPPEIYNKHSFLHKAAFHSPDTLRVTYLDKEELGKPIFNVRFLLDMEDIAFHYLDELCEELKKDDQPMPNRIADYFRHKVKNITDSGMSKEGFSMDMNTTRNIHMTRTKKKGNIENLKGGKK